MSKPNPSSTTAECVKVMIRVRPMNTKEKNLGCSSIVDVDAKLGQICLKKADTTKKEPPKLFTYDAVFHTDSTQRGIYEEAGFPLVESVIEGYNGTIFAYGQTGCGKTHTMVGPKDATPDSRGIIPNAFSHVFGSISTLGSEKKFLLRCSYLEIYNEGIHDLLEYNEDKRLELKEDPQKGIYVKGLTTVIVKSVADIETTMENGTLNRHTAETAMNKDSSRSHSIFTIYIETAETTNEGDRIRAGKLNLVDLAGSERQSKTHAEGDRLKEASKINLSLSALGNVISALVDGRSSHVPYRDSKLTRLLQDSLGGNTKTVMVACVSPADYNYDETLSTLRYASRAKSIKNKPRVNEDPKDALLRQYEDEIKNLKDMLEKISKGGAVGEQIRELELVRANMFEEGGVRSIEQMSRSPVGGVPRVEDNFGKSNSLIESELKQKEMQYRSEKEQKEGLQAMLQELEKKFLTGGQEFEEKQREQAKKYKEMQLRLRKQRQKERQLIEEQMEHEEKIYEVEQSFMDIKEELKDKTKKLKQLKIKYDSANAEIKDLQREHQDEKEAFLDTIRNQDKEIDFYKKIVEIMVSEGELAKIRSRTEWDDESNGWNVPPFVVQNRTINLPKLPRSQITELIDNDKRSRDLIFTGDALEKAEKKYSFNSKSQQNFPPSPINHDKPSVRFEHAKLSAAKGKHMFNWEILEKSKFMVGDSNKIHNSIAKKNAHLESLQFNPASTLNPMDDDKLVHKIISSEPPSYVQAQRRVKMLSKIDEAMLSSNARSVPVPIDSPSRPVAGYGKSYMNHPQLGAVGRLMPISRKPTNPKIGDVSPNS